jgi:hypothetical protein
LLGWLSPALAAADPLASAPTRARHDSPGLVVGEASGVALDRWLAAHPRTVTSPRPRAGLDVHHVSTDRVFPIRPEATSVHEDARTSLQSVLGPPTRTGDADRSMARRSAPPRRGGSRTCRWTPRTPDREPSSVRIQDNEHLFGANSCAPPSRMRR